MSLHTDVAMTRRLFPWAILATASAQIFDTGSSGVAPLTYPPPDGLSSACNATFANPINCSPLLPKVAWEGYFPTLDDLRFMCKSTCLQSLSSFRSKQLASCKSDIEVVAGEAWPATYNVDYFLFTYNSTCRTDKQSNEWCAPIFDAWANATPPAGTESCSDCVLGTLQTDLNSPFGYDADLVQNFTSMTSSCKSQGYPITSPPPYLASATPTATTSGSTSTASSCANPYTVKDGDDCRKISIAQSVSTSDLLYRNGLEGYCANFPKAGQKLCLPAKCDVYTVQKNDTCFGITQANNDAMSISQLVSWNANLNRDCSNIGQYVDMQICISFPGESGSAPVETPSSVNAPVPSNVADQTNTNCSRYYTIATGDYCSYVTLQEGISLPDFYFLNPGVNSTSCNNLLLGIAYCVAPVGDIAAYPGYGGNSGPADPCKAVSAAATCFATTYQPAPTWDWPTAAATASPTTTSRAGPLPLASGTLTNCTRYDQAYPSGPDDNYDINGCYFVAKFHGITTKQLTDWNPSLQFDSENPTSCALASGSRYCVSMTGNGSSSGVPTTTKAPVTTSDRPTSTQATPPTGTCSGGVPPPEQTQNGEPCWCQTWVKQQDGKYCGDMASEAGISLDELYALNPPLNGDCSGLFQGYAYCVGPVPQDPKCVGGTKPPGPVQAGISCKCNKWVNQQDGKYCGDMAQVAGISLSQLYSLNPALNGDCSGLFQGYTYCIGLAP